MAIVQGKFVSDNECAYLVSDSSGQSGVMVFAYWIDEKAAASRRLAAAGRNLVSIDLIQPNAA